MRQIKLALIILLAGCAASRLPDFPKTRDVSTITRGYELTSGATQTQDSLKMGIEYFPQDSLDVFFRDLNITSAGQAFMLQIPESQRAKAEKEQYNCQQRIKAIINCAITNDFFDESTLGKLDKYLPDLDVATLSNQTGQVDFIGSLGFQAARMTEETIRNPYRLYDYIGQMDLDVFRILIENQSSVAKRIDPMDFYLMDDAGNQQRPIPVDYFESLYMRPSQGPPKPARYANVQRTLLTDSPVFPNTTRKFFLAFYPISDQCKNTTIVFSHPEIGQAFSWEFEPFHLTLNTKYFNVGVIVKQPKGLGSEWDGLKNMLVFSDQFENVNVTAYGGIASISIDSQAMNRNVSIYAIGAGDPKEEKGATKVSVIFARVYLPSDAAGKWFQIKTKKYVVEL